MEGRHEEGIHREDDMRTEIAQKDLGICRACLGRVEAGEWASTEGGQTIHTGCASWRSENRVIGHTESSGFLFSESEDAAIERAKEILGVDRMVFDGPSAMQIDVPRLAGQLARVYSLMADGKYRTLEQIALATGCLETSASARLRDLRKTKFGRHTVIARPVDGVPLVYEYRLLLNEEKAIDERLNAA